MVKEGILEQLSLGNMEVGKDVTVSFAGCGFLGIYHVGVASCLKQYAPHLVEGKIAGASAGALTAAALITGCCLGQATSWTLAVARKARSKTLGPFNPTFNVVKLIREGFDQSLPPDAHIVASGRLHISLTSVPDRKNVVVSQFDTREDLIQALICSSFVPLWSGVIPPTYKGKRYIDGGISDNIPLQGENTITVSPFAGESDICPRDTSENFMHINLANTSIQFTMGNMYRFTHALYPPEPHVLSSMCQQGFNDTLKFLQTHNLVTCSRHMSVHSSIQSAVPVQGDEHWEDEAHSSAHQRHLAGALTEHGDRESGCNECQRLQAPLYNSLSPPIVTALQAACESVHTGVFGPLYKWQAFRVLSLMVAPWTVPVDAVLVLGKKFFTWAPYMPADARWFVVEFVELFKYMVHYLHHRRKKYSARFTCQLAITEVEFNKTRNKMLRPNKSPAERQLGPHRQRNLNVGFSMDFNSTQRSPVEQVDEFLHHIEESESSNVEVHKLPTVSQSSVNLKASEEAVANSTVVDHTTYDTFENCLHIANQMDSVLAYYYLDDKNPGVIRVTEIFGLDNQEPSISRNTDTMDLAWDNYVGVHGNEDSQEMSESGTSNNVESETSQVKFSLES